MKLDNIHGIVITVIDYIPIIKFHITISIVESPLSLFSFFLINYPPLILIMTSNSLNGYFFSLSLSLVLPSLFARLKSRESGDLGKNFYFRELWLRNYVNRGTSHYGMTDIWKNRGERYFCGGSKATLGCVFMNSRRIRSKAEKGFCRVTLVVTRHTLFQRRKANMRRVINASRGKKGFSSTVDSCERRRGWRSDCVASVV